MNYVLFYISHSAQTNNQFYKTRILNFLNLKSCQVFLYILYNQLYWHFLVYFENIVNFPTGFISFLKSPLVTRKRLMKTVGRLKSIQIMAFLQSSSAFFYIPLSNQKKADENCRKIKVTQIMTLLQSSSAFFKFTLSNQKKAKKRLMKTVGRLKKHRSRFKFFHIFLP